MNMEEARKVWVWGRGSSQGERTNPDVSRLNMTSLSSLVLGQANYIYILASAPAFLLASLLQADLAQL